MRYFEIDIKNIYAAAFPVKREPTPAEALAYLRQHDSADFLQTVTDKDVFYFGELEEWEAKGVFCIPEDWPPLE
jgi:hypothetical protein